MDHNDFSSIPVDKEVDIPPSKHPLVVIIGAGFAGINLVKGLKKAPVQVVLTDKNNFHHFQPLLYQVAIAGLEPDSVVSPVRKLFQNYRNFLFRMLEIVKIDPEKKLLYSSKGVLRYDYLIIATGSTPNFYGLDRIRENSIGLKTIRDALNIRSWILQNLEEAVITTNKDKKDLLTNFVIVGGGPTGVELAGALAEFKQYHLIRDYPDLMKELMEIYLIEAVDRLLPTMSEKASAHASKVLKNLDVRILLNTSVEDYDGETVKLKKREPIKSNTLLWTAGVKGESPSGIAFNDKTFRIPVNKFNQVKGYEDIFAIGDVALMQSDNFPKGHPMLAPVAIQQGEQLAKNLIHQLQTGKFNAPFEYKDKGTMATIGKKRAVADIKNKTITGWMGWVIWSTVHLLYLSSFKNKLMVIINWIMKYFTYEKANRLIIRTFDRDNKKVEV